MDTLGDRLSDIHLRVSVPGTEIQGELHERGKIDISFGPDTYQRLRQSHLEHHLATVARLLYAGWMREYRAVLSSSLLEVDPPEDVRNRDYEEARNQIRTRGSSGDGRISVSAVGLHNFTVHIAPGTLHELSEQEFVARAREAATAFLENRRAQIRELRPPVLHLNDMLIRHLPIGSCSAGSVTRTVFSACSVSRFQRPASGH